MTVRQFSPSLFYLLCSLLFVVAGCDSSKSSQEKSLLRAGPMLGDIAEREANIWIQTRVPARTLIEYWDTTDPKTRWRTPVLETNRHSAYTLTHVLDSVQPEHTYAYRVIVNGKVVKRDYPLRFTTPPPPFYGRVHDVKFAFGSCHKLEDDYPDSTDDAFRKYSIYQSIIDAKPEFMLWLGDNLYLRAVDWTSRSGYLHRYSHVRAFSPLQPLLAAMPHYAIWDDHDYGPNNTDRIHPRKGVAYEMFELFWANPRNDALPPPINACSFTRGDAEFLLLDNRSQRSPNEFSDEPDATQWGEAQYRWLIDFLKSSPATFKFVVTGGQVLNDYQKYEIMANTHPAELKRLIADIRKHKIHGVVFLTGDRHLSEVSALPLGPGAPTLYDITSSPMTSGTFDTSEDEPNSRRVPGTWAATRNFGLIEITGKDRDRVLSLNLIDANGKPVWEKPFQIHQHQLEWDNPRVD